MVTHVMTPARRAALRKAQLASAAKRRRSGVGSQVRRATSQKGQYYAASANVASRNVRRHVGTKGFKSKVKKGAKYTAIGLGGAALVAGAGGLAAGAAGGYAANVVSRAASNPNKGGARVIPGHGFTMGAPYKPNHKKQVKRLNKAMKRRRF